MHQQLHTIYCTNASKCLDLFSKIRANTVDAYINAGAETQQGSVAVMELLKPKERVLVHNHNRS